MYDYTNFYSSKIVFIHTTIYIYFNQVSLIVVGNVSQTMVEMLVQTTSFYNLPVVCTSTRSIVNKVRFDIYSSLTLMDLLTFSDRGSGGRPYKKLESPRSRVAVYVTAAMPFFQVSLTHLCRPVRSTFAVRETASLGIMGEPRVPPLNPSESIVL